MHAPDSETSRLASLIDHTLLRPEASRAEIDRLCDEAMAHGFATVCVNPAWVAVCADRLRAGRRRGDGSTPDVADASYPPCGVCTVVGFPLGASVSDVKAYETRRAIADGATEIDMVINIGALKSGDLELVARDIRAVTRVCRDARVVSKVIVEAALLSDEEKVTVCMLADAADADFVKTSTGCGPGGATATDVALMRRTVRARMGVKASGGIRTLATLREMVQAGAARIGTSAGVRIMAEARNGQAHSARGA